MTQIRDDSRDFRLDKEYQPQKFFEHAVHNHWDPYEDVSQELLVADREKLVDRGLTNDEFEEFGLLFEADALVEYASEKFDHRMNTITDDDRELPPVEQLVRVER